jgi:2,4-dienoyl-CoA reductase (NADPH2)
VITFGRFEPDEAERVLADGKADFIGMGRKLLADPDLPNKLASGRTDDIRPCIYQYRCIGNIFVKESLHCVGNAATGREHDFAMGPSASPRRILVVGGGPAGLEAARVLRGRGHDVTIWEGAIELGGMLRHARHADPLLDRYLGWIVRQVEQGGVHIELGRSADAAAVRSAGFDEVVVATGAEWGAPELPGADAPHVFTVPQLDDWLRDDGDAVGANVVILGGGKPAMSIGMRALERGRAVAIVEPTHVFCTELGLPGRWRLVADIEKAGALLVANATVEAIDPASVRVRVGDAREDIPADTVIVTSGATPRTSLVDELAATGMSAHVIGDCAGIRRIEGANLDANNLALALG